MAETNIKIPSPFTKQNKWQKVQIFTLGCFKTASPNLLIYLFLGMHTDFSTSAPNAYSGYTTSILHSTMEHGYGLHATQSYLSTLGTCLEQANNAPTVSSRWLITNDDQLRTELSLDNYSRNPGNWSVLQFKAPLATGRFQWLEIHKRLNKTRQ